MRVIVVRVPHVLVLVISPGARRVALALPPIFFFLRLELVVVVVVAAAAAAAVAVAVAARRHRHPLPVAFLLGIPLSPYMFLLLRDALRADYLCRRLFVVKLPRRGLGVRSKVSFPRRLADGDADGVEHSEYDSPIE